MRLTVIAHESPYPPVHGGRADVWHRLVALRDLGHPAQLVFWHDAHLTADESSTLASASAGLVQLRQRPRWEAALELRYPPRVRRFVPRASEWERALSAIRSFGPSALLLENWPAYLFAGRLSAVLGVPLIYRAQNVETDYWRGQVAAAGGLRKLRLALTASRIARLEQEIRTSSAAVLDISQADFERARELRWAGAVHEVLRPTWNPGPSGCARASSTIDVLFVGNLWTPNNLAGVAWLLDEVLPRLRTQRPGLRVTIAGSGPSAPLLERCRAAGVICIPDPADLKPLYDTARVLVNPQRAGGGVSIKMIEFLVQECHVVSTSSGVMGLPRPLPLRVRVADDPARFAGAILEAVQATVPEDERDAYVRRHFGAERLASVMARVQQLLPGHLGKGQQ